MDRYQKIDRVFNELERLARTLKKSSEAPERHDLLRDMRRALDEADSLILPKSNSANA